MEIVEMTLNDYEDVVELWKDTEGIVLDDDDSKTSIDRYLKRNPGLSFVARSAGILVGTALCGHDGRRGILRHVAVKPEFRSQRVAEQLIAKCLVGLHTHGISKCNAFVLEENISGQLIWQHLGFNMLQRDFKIMQILTKDLEK